MTVAISVPILARVTGPWQRQAPPIVGPAANMRDALNTQTNESSLDMWPNSRNEHEVFEFDLTDPQFVGNFIITTVKLRFQHTRNCAGGLRVWTCALDAQGNLIDGVRENLNYDEYFGTSTVELQPRAELANGSRWFEHPRVGFQIQHEGLVGGAGSSHLLHWVTADIEFEPATPAVTILAPSGSALEHDSVDWTYLSQAPQHAYEVQIREDAGGGGVEAVDATAWWHNDDFVVGQAQWTDRNGGNVMTLDNNPGKDGNGDVLFTEAGEEKGTWPASLKLEADPGDTHTAVAYLTVDDVAENRAILSSRSGFTAGGGGAVTSNHLDEQTSGSTQQRITSNSFTPTADAVIVVVAHAYIPQSGAVHAWDIDDSAGGLGWIQRGTAGPDFSVGPGDHPTEAVIWTAQAPSSPGSMTVDFEAHATHSVEWGYQIFELPGADPTNPFKELLSAYPGGNPQQVTTQTLTSAPTDHVVACFMGQRGSSGTVSWDSVPAGWAALSAGLTAIWHPSRVITHDGTDQSVTWGVSGSASMFGFPTFIFEANPAQTAIPAGIVFFADTSTNIAAEWSDEDEVTQENSVVASDIDARRLVALVTGATELKVYSSLTGFDATPATRPAADFEDDSKQVEVGHHLFSGGEWWGEFALKDLLYFNGQELDATDLSDLMTDLDTAPAEATPTGTLVFDSGRLIGSQVREVAINVPMDPGNYRAWVRVWSLHPNGLETQSQWFQSAFTVETPPAPLLAPSSVTATFDTDEGIWDVDVVLPSGSPLGSRLIIERKISPGEFVPVYTLDGVDTTPGATVTFKDLRVPFREQIQWRARITTNGNHPPSGYANSIHYREDNDVWWWIDIENLDRSLNPYPRVYRAREN